MSLRSLVLFFMPKALRAKAEADSRSWIATCPNCAKATSIWDLGGLRYKAAGKPSMGFTCGGCGKFGLHPVRKQ